jgi:hypothetical protein
VGIDALRSYDAARFERAFFYTAALLESLNLFSNGHKWKNGIASRYWMA